MLTAFIWAFGNLWAVRTVSSARMLGLMVIVFAVISALASYCLHLALGSWSQDILLQNTIITFFGAILGGGVIAVLGWRRRRPSETTRSH